MSEAYELFRTLSPSDASGGAYSAVPFPEQPTHRLAVNSSGEAVVLVRTCGDAGGIAHVPVRTENIEVTFSSPYEVRYPSGNTTADEVFTAVTCRIVDPPIVRYFLSVVGGLLTTLGPGASADEVDTAVRSVAHLFQALAVPATKSVQGLWAELFLLASSSDRELAAAAWHSAPEDRYDFARGADRLEVKSSSRRRRVHHFSLDQLTPAAGVTLWIASIFVERSGGGLTLEALLAEVCASLSPDQATRIRRVTAVTLGASFANALELGFDRELARESLRYFWHASIPCVARPVPPELVDVRFKADLSALEPGTPVAGIFLVFPPSGGTVNGL